MSLYTIKPRFQNRLRALARRLAGRSVSADALTAWGLLFAALAGVVLALGGRTGWLLLAPPLLFARIACNALDGMVARLAGTARPWGTVLNETTDRVADLLCFGGLVASGALPPVVAVALLPLVLFVSYLGVIGQAAGGARRYEGPLGKADRMLLLALYCLLAPLSAHAGSLIGWALIAGLSVTAVNRLRAIARDCRTADSAQRVAPRDPATQRG
ncbi:MAG TPA: CDP-alcohol phosphatidyltransferase family protein [Thermomicrobiales bacterium]|nr:CDP-alcohol phosphatidyltransferase family protein [Thermomicrobiales bacterium]